MPDATLLVTMGDACGIGPETIIRAAQRGALAGGAVVGDIGVLRRASAILAATQPMALIDTPTDLAEVPADCIAVLQPDGLPVGLEALPWGRVDARCGTAAARCIEAAVGWIRAGQARALVTAPIHKEALAAAGIGFPGHTEMLQALSAPAGVDPPPVRMMLANPELRVVLVSIHVSLRHAIDLVSHQSVLDTL